MAQQKYSILSKIDAGGMAEVWKGTATTSRRGFEKLVAIKRVLPNLSKNRKFISMFLDEARLSLHLNHANIVQTFDIGMADDAYFIVMEWVDGCNLKSILETAQDLGFTMPVEQAVFIAGEICRGLSHAHSRRDLNDRPLAIVHRDISPPNVLISREGEIKLVDFGLAKAASQVTTTDPGVVKGKFSYLSPEAACGKEVDPRADLFAVGIVLWEMLAGRRLFYGESDRETVQQVRAAVIPDLSAINPSLDPALQRIIERSLAREPKQRYQTAEEFNHDLMRFLFSNRMMVTNYDISALVKRVLLERAQKKAREEPLTSNAVAHEAVVAAEIDRFISLEDLEKMEFRSVADDGSGRDDHPTTNAEDPRAWADELGVTDPDDTLMDIPPGKRPRAAPRVVQPAEQRSASAPEPMESLPRHTGSTRTVSIPPPPGEPMLPSERLGPTSARPDERTRQARAEAAAAIARQAQPHVALVHPPPTGPHHLAGPTGRYPAASVAAQNSVLVGIVLGVVAAGVIGTAAWYFLFR